MGNTLCTKGYKKPENEGHKLLRCLNLNGIQSVTKSVDKIHTHQYSINFSRKVSDFENCEAKIKYR